MGRLEHVRLLLSRGADVNQTGSGWPPLHLAALRFHADVVKLLLESGAQVNVTAFYNLTGTRDHGTALKVTQSQGTFFQAKSRKQSGFWSRMELLHKNKAGLGNFPSHAMFLAELSSGRGKEERKRER
jgi:ankyrin repeat protein